MASGLTKCELSVYAKIKAEFMAQNQNYWWSQDFQSIELKHNQIPPYMDPPYPEEANPRYDYGVMFLAIMDENPAITPTDLARQFARSASWVYEVVRHARSRRDAEMLSFLVEA